MQKNRRIKPTLQPSRTITAWSQTGGNLYSKILQLWQIMFLSCGADVIIFSRHPNALSHETAVFFSLITAGLLFPLLSQSRLHRFLQLLRASQKKNLQEDRKIIVGSAIVMALLATSAKLFLAIKLPLIPAFILVGAILIAAMRGSKKFIEEIRKERERFKNNPLSQIERWEEQVVALSLIPMFLARSIGLFGALQSSEVGASFEVVAPFTVVSVIFLAMLKPTPQMFRSFCRRCKQPVPLVVVSLGSCTQCDSNLKISE
jgi:hypothetical protein